MKASFKQAAEAIERMEAVEAQRQEDYAELAAFFAKAAQTDSRFEYEAQFYANLTEDKFAVIE